jgi:hypothetical protein
LNVLNDRSYKKRLHPEPQSEPEPRPQPLPQAVYTPNELINLSESINEFELKPFNSQI